MYAAAKLDGEDEVVTTNVVTPGPKKFSKFLAKKDSCDGCFLKPTACMAAEATA